MIDLHTHLLPGIDDGPKTLEESLQMCRLAAESGTTKAICTPHIHPGRWENSARSIEQKCDKLRQALQENNIPLELGYAGEVRLSEHIFGLVKENQIPFYSEVDGYKIMLLEFPHGHIVPGSEKLTSWLLAQGIRPLIAHPERNKQIMRDPNQLAPFLEMGCWLQVTAGSITGAFGSNAETVAHSLLKEGAVSVVASDGHNTGARQPVLQQSYELVSSQYGEGFASRLHIETPAKIVEA